MSALLPKADIIGSSELSVPSESFDGSFCPALSLMINHGPLMSPPRAARSSRSSTCFQVLRSRRSAGKWPSRTQISPSVTRSLTVGIFKDRGSLRDQFGPANSVYSSRTQYRPNIGVHPWCRNALLLILLILPTLKSLRGLIAVS
jgi:hypothetical protein